MEASSAQSAPTLSLADRIRRRPAWQALANRDFRLLWMGQTVSVVGDQFYFIALPWLTLQLTGSGVALGTVLMAAAIPRGMFVLFGGAIADRLSPRLLMLGSNLVRMALIGLLAALVLLGVAQLFELLLIAFLFGTSDAVFYPAYDTMPPLLLDEENLHAGNALLQGSTMLSQIVGPGVAGLAIATLGGKNGSGVAFALDAATFAVSAVTLLLIRKHVRVTRKSEEQGQGERAGILGDIRAGIAYAWKDPVLRVLLGLIIVSSVAVNPPAEVGIPWLARNHFHGGAAAFGLMFTVFGVGALLGTVTAGLLGRLRRRTLIVVGVALVISVAFALVGIAPNVLVASVVVGMVGIGSGFVSIVLVTWLQTRTAPAMMGRVMSILSFASGGLSPLALAPAGAIAQYNVTVLFVVGGAAMALAAVATLASRAVRTAD